MNGTLYFHSASLRSFDPHERHITRICRCDVLLMVYEGVLRFSEDGEEYEVTHGYYHIQRSGSYQQGIEPSASPKYLYVHFDGEWGSGSSVLPRSGKFDVAKMLPLMEELDRACHSGRTRVEQASMFCGILTQLYRGDVGLSAAARAAAYLAEHYAERITLEQLCDELHFSRNHVINLFHREFSVTPFEYLNRLRVREAERLLEATALSAERISALCGFSDYSAFYRLFRKHTGVSPNCFRAMATRAEE